MARRPGSGIECSATFPEEDGHVLLLLLLRAGGYRDGASFVLFGWIRRGGVARLLASRGPARCQTRVVQVVEEPVTVVS